MRIIALLALSLALSAQPVAAQRKDSTPLVKSSPTVAPCLKACEAEFAVCESKPAATDKICPEARLACIVRCDPAVLASDTLKAMRRTPEELRYKPLTPQTPFEQCRQACQDRRAVCLERNQPEACDPATTACYSRCDESHGTAPATPKPAKSTPPKAKTE